MKRGGKCVGKKAYPYSYLAIEVAKHQYIKHNKCLGFYECPTCLDFHLTSKYVNLQHLHASWNNTKTQLAKKGGGTRRTQKKKLQRQRAKARKLLGIPPPIPKPKEKNVWSGDILKVLASCQVQDTPWWQFWKSVL